MLQVQENFSLQAYNTFGIDVKASYYAAFDTEADLKEILLNPMYKSIPKLFLGGGSNVLFTKDYQGLVLRNRLKGKKIISSNADKVLVEVAAGEVWHELVLFTLENNLAGIENLSLIPGSVGAAPMQNIGAYGVELKDVFYSLRAMNRETGEVRSFNAEQCLFGYRESVFKKEFRDVFVILSVQLMLSTKANLNTKYGAIEEELKNRKVSNPSIHDVSTAVCAIRSSKLPDPKVNGNAGSFFKNPTVPISTFDSLKKEFPEIVAYPAGEEHMKLAAGWLIEQCGWKGKSIGKAGVHAKQALVIINLGGATGSELYELSLQVKKSVAEKFGIDLETEVNIL